MNGSATGVERSDTSGSNDRQVLMRFGLKASEERGFTSSCLSCKENMTSRAVYELQRGVHDPCVFRLFLTHDKAISQRLFCISPLILCVPLANPPRDVAKIAKARLGWLRKTLQIKNPPALAEGFLKPGTVLPFNFQLLTLNSLASWLLDPS